MQWWKWRKGMLVTHTTQIFPNGSPNKPRMFNTLVFRFLTMDFAFPDFCSYGGKDLELVVQNIVKICHLHNYISSMFHRRTVGSFKLHYQSQSPYQQTHTTGNLQLIWQLHSNNKLQISIPHRNKTKYKNTDKY